MIQRMHQAFEGGRPTLDAACRLVCAGLLVATLGMMLTIALRLVA